MLLHSRWPYSIRNQDKVSEWQTKFSPIQDEGTFLKFAHRILTVAREGQISKFLEFKLAKATSLLTTTHLS